MRPAVPGVAAVAALAVGLAAQAGWLAPATPVVAMRTLPAAVGTPDLLCPGPETLVVPKGGQAQPSGGSVVTSVVARPAGEAAEGTVLATVTPLTGGKSGAVNDEGGAGVALPSTRAAGGTVVGAVVPDGGKVPSVAAAQSTVARNGDLRGLVGTTCGAASDDVWLVGGGTHEGRRLRLVLANPGPAAAVADVQVHGARGVVEAPSGDGVVVPPGRQVAVLVDALAPDQRQVAVHVTTRSGRVRATLHDSELAGLIATGADDVPIAGAPARTQVVPGIWYEPVQPGPGSSVTTSGGQVAGAIGRPGATAVRVAVPGNEPALVRVQLLGDQGLQDVPGGGVLEVPAGGVADLPLYGPRASLYAAVVTADVPVLASAVIGRSVPGSALANTSQRSSPLVRPAEFAWTTAVGPLTGTATYAVPPAPAVTRLALTATGEAEKIGLTYVSRSGAVSEERVVNVPGRTTVPTQLPDGTAGVVVRAVDDRGGVVAAAVSEVEDRGGTMVTVQPLVPAQRARPAPAVRQDANLGLG